MNSDINQRDIYRGLVAKIRRVEDGQEREESHDVPSRNNYRASSAPSSSNNLSEGYSVGSEWIVPGVGYWKCISSSVGSSVWVQIWP